MKRQVLALVMLVIMALTVSAQAVETRSTGVQPYLSFSGTTAICTVQCKGDSARDEIKATLTLYQGTTYVDSWSGSGTGIVPIYGECTVRSGKSYTLKVTYSINGITKPSVSTTATCP
ncbi:MAG: hypothetical protein ACI4TK_12790 [Agathobacter sp.]